MNILLAQAPITADSLVQWLTPVLVPLIITGIKKWKPGMPTWLIPMLAPVLGALIDILNGLIIDGHHNILVGALLGLAGVGVREIKTNLIPPKEDKNSPSNVTPIEPPPK